MYSTASKAPPLVSNQQVRPKELLPNGEYLPRELDFKLLDLNKTKQPEAMLYILKVAYSEKLGGPGSCLSLDICLEQQPSRFICLLNMLFSS
jgi:hypothetical protein